jgi:hypothetical protein
MLNEKNREIFCWNNLLSSFEEGDIKGLAEFRTYF